MKKIFSYLFVLILVFSLVACGGGGTETPEEPKELEYAEGTTLNLAVTHDGNKTSISFKDASITGEGLVLADGKEYHTDDLKPVWAELEKVLKVEFNDVLTGKKAAQEFEAWQQLGYVDANNNSVDVLVGNASDIAEAGKRGEIVNLADWLDYMPNFKAFLDENPIVKLSVLSDVETGAIHYAPYFDGFDDIEKYFIMRHDWVKKLLDGEGSFSAEISDLAGAVEYEPYMPTSGSVTIDSLNAAGDAVIQITKNYDTTYGNIVAYMNSHITAATTGVELVNMLRGYIDVAYGGIYGTQRSDLFLGHNAAWDADELVALLRCVVANTYALTGQNEQKVTGVFPRETGLNRVADLYSFAALFGVRGNESRNEYLYFNAEGELVDARGEEDFAAAIDRLNDLYKEGLILQDYRTKEKKIGEAMYKSNLGFMLYDYCQTQCLWNDKSETQKYEGFYLSPVMTPVAKWYDGSSAEGTYMRFTESWRSVKTNGWCIPATCTGDKLQAALKLFDYMYSEEGNILMSFGPNAWRSGETIDYKGTQQPEMSDAAKAELWNLASGNYTNYARYYLGSTLPVGFVKNQAMEYQCTTEAGKAGALVVSKAIALGTVKHVSPYIGDNLFYTMVPTILPTDEDQDTLLSKYGALSEMYNRESSGKYNFYDELIRVGFGSTKAPETTYLSAFPASAAAYVQLYKEELGGNEYAFIKQGAWQSLKDYYDANK